MRSVDASPMSTTSMPCWVRPRANASTRDGPDGRMSASDDDAIRAGSGDEGGESDTQGVCDVGIDLVVHGATDVVSLDDLIQD